MTFPRIVLQISLVENRYPHFHKKEIVKETKVQQKEQRNS